MLRSFHYLLGVTLFFFAFTLASPSLSRVFAQKKKPNRASVEELLDQKEEEENCNYDVNDMRIFTLDAIKSYNPKLPYVWNDTQKTAHFLYKQDSVTLQIGGCDIFSYSATYLAKDVDSFENEDYVTEKVRWLARNFFSSGFDIKYIEAIRDGRYFLDSSRSNATRKTYRLDNIDTSIVTNQVFRGFGVKKKGKMIEIWANAYFK